MGLNLSQYIRGLYNRLEVRVVVHLGHNQSILCWINRANDIFSTPLLKIERKVNGILNIKFGSVILTLCQIEASKRKLAAGVLLKNLVTTCISSKKYDKALSNTILLLVLDCLKY